MTTITQTDILQSVRDALQYISYYHPPDFIRHLASAYAVEQSPPARNAMAQILRNSRMCAIGKRPICQDTGVANVFVRLGVKARLDIEGSLQDIINEAVRQAYLAQDNPLRASMVRDPLFDRTNTGDNSPGIVHVELVAGERMDVHVSAKGGGSENKSKFAVLDPGSNIADWVVRSVETLGAGWCPPGILGIGVGGGADKAMLLAKQALNEPLNMSELLKRGPASPNEEMRIEIYDRVNSLGIGAQGLGGMTTVLDVKLRTFPAHAASVPVGLIPNCAATRHIHFQLDGAGPATFEPPGLSDWPDIEDANLGEVRRVDLNALSAESVKDWRVGETLLLSGTLFTGRDAAHRKLVDVINSGGKLPVDLKEQAIYYVGPVNAVGDEVIGPAGPTTSTRMDRYLETILPGTGLRVMIGKAERGLSAIEQIKSYGTPYLVAVGGAAFLVAQAIRSAEIVAWPELGMEAIYKLQVQDMPVLVGVSASGESIHVNGPKRWVRAGVSERLD